MSENTPTEAQLKAVEKALMSRRGFRQTFDEVTFADDRREEDVPEDEEWTPLQREILTDIARAVLRADQEEERC